MVPPPSSDGTPAPDEAKPAKEAVARRRLTEKMANLGTKIDKQKMGSEQRLESLRKQASLSDEREALNARRG